MLDANAFEFIIESHRLHRYPITDEYCNTTTSFTTPVTTDWRLKTIYADIDKEVCYPGFRYAEYINFMTSTEYFQIDKSTISKDAPYIIWQFFKFLNFMLWVVSTHSDYDKYWATWSYRLVTGAWNSPGHFSAMVDNWESQASARLQGSLHHSWCIVLPFAWCDGHAFSTWNRQWLRRHVSCNDKPHHPSFFIFLTSKLLTKFSF